MIYLTESERLKAIALCDAIQASIAKVTEAFDRAKQAADEFDRAL
jgi:hypothetical protein